MVSWLQKKVSSHNLIVLIDLHGIGKLDFQLRAPQDFGHFHQNFSLSSPLIPDQSFLQSGQSAWQMTRVLPAKDLINCFPCCERDTYVRLLASVDSLRGTVTRVDVTGCPRPRFQL